MNPTRRTDKADASIEKMERDSKALVPEPLPAELYDERDGVTYRLAVERQSDGWYFAEYADAKGRALADASNTTLEATLADLRSAPGVCEVLAIQERGLCMRCQQHAARPRIDLCNDCAADAYAEMLYGARKSETLSASERNPSLH